MATDLSNEVASVPVGVETRLYRPSPIDEELDGGRLGQPGDREEDFAGDTQRLSARGDQSETRYRTDQGLGKCGRGVDHVFTVVQDDDERAPG